MLHELSGAGAPSTTPTAINQHYTNTTNGDIYFSKGTTSAADWVLMTTGAAPVTSVFGRTGAVTAQTGDYTYSQVGADASGSASAVQSNLNSHTGNTSNPHSVTASQVGNSTAQWNADKLQGRNVVSTAPTNGQALAWNSTSSQWEPQTISSSGGSPNVITVSATTTQLTSADEEVHILKGTTGGQIIKLPNATTLLVGAEYTFVNASEAIVCIRDYSDGIHYLMLPAEKIELVCTDITTPAGVWELEVYASNIKDSGDFEDFNQGLTSTGNIGQLGWILSSANGTGTVAYQAATTNKSGILQVNTSTSNDAAVAISQGVNAFLLGYGHMSCEWMVMLPTAGGTGASAHTSRFGIQDTTGTADTANGAYFEIAWTGASAPNIFCKTANASTRTSTDSGVAIAAATWFKLTVAVASDLSQATFSIDNVHVATITTNLPANTATLGPIARMYSSATNVAAKSFQVDYCRQKIGRNNIR